MRRLLLYAVFFVSGAAMIVYEVVWQRMLGTVFGNTSSATAVILTVFFTGIAAGNLVFSRRVERLSARSALRRYALFELGTGLWAAGTPWLLGHINAIERSLISRAVDLSSPFTLTAFLLTAAFLFIPTFFMGGTFPLLSRAVSAAERMPSRVIAWLYAINALGGSVGAIIAAFVLIERFGLTQTVGFAAVTSVFIACAVAFFTVAYPSGTAESAASAMHARAQGAAEMQQQATGAMPREAKQARLMVMISLGLFGLFFLSLEVLWTKALVLIVGSAVYGFSLILASILLGIALGSMVDASYVRRIKRPLHTFYILTIMCSLGILAIVVLFDRFPGIYASINLRFVESFIASQTALYIFVFCITVPVSLCAGILFPLGVRIMGELTAGSFAKSFGEAFGWNTLGGVVGPLFTGIVLIPLVGIEKSMLFFSFCYALVGFLGMVVLRKERNIVAMAVLVISGLALVVVPAWSKNAMLSGVFMYGRNTLDAPEKSNIIFYKEGSDGIVAVREFTNGERSLSVNGKVIASRQGDQSTMLLTGHLPVLLHKDPKEVLIVGVGSGISTGAILSHPTIESVEQVEIEPAVVEASRFFDKENRSALDDPRLTTIIGDGRRFLYGTERTYDVIISEPSNPWISGMASLFTKEYFSLARARLKEGGLMFQWMQYYRMSPEDVAMVIRTYQSVFPHVTVWMSPLLADIFLVGSETALTVDPAALAERFANESVRTSLAPAYMEEPADIFRAFIMDEKTALRFGERALSIHTDDHPLLEFVSPRSMYLPTIGTNAALFTEVLSDPRPLIVGVQDAAFQDRLSENLDIRVEALERVRERE